MIKLRTPFTSMHSLNSLKPQGHSMKNYSRNHWNIESCWSEWECYLWTNNCKIINPHTDWTDRVSMQGHIRKKRIINSLINNFNSDHKDNYDVGRGQRCQIHTSPLKLSRYIAAFCIQVAIFNLIILVLVWAHNYSKFLI